MCGGARAAGRRDANSYLVDGGYHEGSAAATVLELWNALAPLVDEHNSDAAAPAFIIPFLMQIDNGYGEPAAPGTVPPTPRSSVPLVTVTGSFSPARTGTSGSADRVPARV